MDDSYSRRPFALSWIPARPSRDRLKSLAERADIFWSEASNRKRELAWAFGVKIGDPRIEEDVVSNLSTSAEIIIRDALENAFEYAWNDDRVLLFADDSPLRTLLPALAANAYLSRPDVWSERRDWKDVAHQQLLQQGYEWAPASGEAKSTNAARPTLLRTDAARALGGAWLEPGDVVTKRDTVRVCNALTLFFPKDKLSRNAVYQAIRVTR